MMDVYLVPVGPDRFECYYEAAEQDETDEPVEGAGLLRADAREVQRAVEGSRAGAPSEGDRRADDVSRPHAEAQHALDRRAHRRAAAVVAPAQGRRGDAAHARPICPAEQAEAIMRASMKRDADHHRNRLILHTLVADRRRRRWRSSRARTSSATCSPSRWSATSWPGAARCNALHQITWTIVPNPALTDLRRAFSLEPRPAIA